MLLTETIKVPDREIDVIQKLIIGERGGEHEEKTVIMSYDVIIRNRGDILILLISFSIWVLLELPRHWVILYGILLHCNNSFRVLVSLYK